MDRRLFLSLLAGTAAGTAVLPHFAAAVPAVPSAAPALPSLVNRRLRLSNPHTGETFEGTYRDDNGAIPEVMDELNTFLRDFHANEQTAIDVAVVDFLALVMDAAGQEQAVILSGYRTPQTNAMLAKTHFGVAENSQHMYGRALDVHFGDKLAEAMRMARRMQRGGVGWYPHSGFMHIDSGPVRNWDLDHTGTGNLIAGKHRLRFNKRGDLLIAKNERNGVAGGRVETAVLRGRRREAAMLTGGQPTTVRQRHSLLRQIAHASWKARTGS